MFTLKTITEVSFFLVKNKASKIKKKRKKNQSRKRGYDIRVRDEAITHKSLQKINKI